MNYSKKNMISTNIWNNAFSYEERKELLGKAEITIPSIKTINSLDQIELSDYIVFEEVDHNGKLRSCKWLKHIYQVRHKWPEIYIFDNHNHALYFRIQQIINHRYYEGWGTNNMETNLSDRQVSWNNIQLTHIDQHSDMNKPSLSLQDYLNKSMNISPLIKGESLAEKDEDKQEDLLSKIRTYTNHICNVGNFIPPFLDLFPQINFQRIKSESELLNYSFKKHRHPEERTKWITWESPKSINILDIDLDFRAPEMSISDIKATIDIIKEMYINSSLITIATSPYFLGQEQALYLLKDILHGITWYQEWYQK